MLAAEIDEDIVGGEQEQPERRHPQVRARWKAHGSAGGDAQDHHCHSGEGEAVDERHLGRDHAELILDRQPARPPDEHGQGVKQKVEHPGQPQKIRVSVSERTACRNPPRSLRRKR
jgi:hypothetical protein